MDRDDSIERLLEQARHEGTPQSYLVLADALQERGDPRGELIVLQHARSEGGAEQARERELLDAHLERLAGFRPGEHVELGWRWGFVERVTLGARATSEDRRAALEAVATRPAARMVRHVTLEEPPSPRGWGNPTNLLHDLFRSLVASGIVLSTVSSVRLGNRVARSPYHQVYRDYEALEADEDLSPVWALFPRLEALVLDLGHAAIQLGAPTSDHLRRFAWVSPWLSEDVLEQIRAMHTPGLEHLEVWTGIGRQVNERDEIHDEGFDELRGDGLVRSDQLEPILAHADGLEQLKRFGLPNFAGTWGELAPRLAGRPAFDRIEVLDVSRGRLPEGEVEAFVAACRRMGRLRKVVAHELCTPDDIWEALRSALGDIALEGSQSWIPSAYTYVSVME